MPGIVHVLSDHLVLAVTRALALVLSMWTMPFAGRMTRRRGLILTPARLSVVGAVVAGVLVIATLAHSLMLYPG